MKKEYAEEIAESLRESDLSENSAMEVKNWLGKTSVVLQKPGALKPDERKWLDELLDFRRADYEVWPMDQKDFDIEVVIS